MALATWHYLQGITYMALPTWHYLNGAGHMELGPRRAFIAATAGSVIAPLLEAGLSEHF